jgi:hypothetical protein
MAAAALALLPTLTLAPAASAASDEWCDVDPLVVIKTPKGNLVTLFNTNGAKGLLHQPTLALTKVSYTVQTANGGRDTLVKMSITVPNDLFGKGYSTRTKISTGPLGTLKVYAAAEGVSGQAMSIQFILDTP